ncbi:polymer-forming cytoskeletal protein [Azoarcus communis]|uniref:Polymer-forming cytoskeletal protein n=1 Tax=Parazoarcus communis SWub3 = DSM 12120 TaxID=1121029 RepID=A0A323V0B1_9RHOO|nr:polymer-forming cytoskeletal protein [Parazoarcus communis]NMG47921.1 polymer-forming cytoskeletal protein [Parazoarcus communis]NMG69835.1 polymer-forming cytoskeletal protein [Parazoarcus communis SWub3 = DSM 12120]PZA18124.1 polymer-forming cytoskeletal protein [Azoarcus communis] [Parazoarcus communis SWub3 = DSM 12120]
MFNKSSPFSKAPDPVVGRSPVKPAVQAPSVPAGAMAESAAVLSPGHDMARGESVAGKGGAATPTTGMDEGRPSRLIVGPDVKLKGAEILDCDTLVVEGRVEATMDSRVIRIAEAGAFHGKVGIDVAEIRGSFEGELTARQQLIIHSSGRVSGKIRYGRILIEEGGEVSGDVQPLSAAEKTRSTTEDKRPAEPRQLAAVSA